MSNMGFISKFTAGTTLSININLEWSCVSATKNAVACGLDMYKSLLLLFSFFESLTAAEQKEASAEPESIASSSSQFLPLAHSSNQSEQNCNSWPNLSRMFKRYQLSDRAGSAFASSVLQDLGLVNEENRSMIIDYHKLQRERQKYREEIRKKKENFSLVDGVYFDGRKDATQVLLQGPNGKLYQSVQLAEHYTLVGEPGTYYLHDSPVTRKWNTLNYNRSFHVNKGHRIG